MMERVGSWTLALTLVALLLFEAWQVFFWLNPNPVFGLIAARKYGSLSSARAFRSRKRP